MAWSQYRNAVASGRIRTKVSVGPQRALMLLAMTERQARSIDVFFYGLFMDDVLLQEKGLNPKNRRIASVENFCLVIGSRATLVPCPGQTAHGVIFSLMHCEVDALYAEASVSVYRPEAVSARLVDGSVIPALCFNLPSPPSLEERNAEYANRLRKLATRIGLPSDYVLSIE
ncbi:MAG: gamma-glutamylcyclotransferase family protein [Pyrinomonadaceae bacterium]